ncbi:MAG: NADH-ubiquinone oxidoreductase-F iron-sulfur binding region domain-containing protein [Acidimicrobiia bacterium]
MLLASTPTQSLDEYVASGGGAALAIAGRLGQEGVFDELELSGLRGRGGAGFPVSAKWRSIAADGPSTGERFVVANGAEGEPGTFKDRYLMRHNPYQLIEGLLVAATALGARRAFIAVKATFTAEISRLTGAADEISRAGWSAGVRVELVRGPDDYLFGEEKALLEVIEGGDALPRQLPPYLHGLFASGPPLGWSAHPREERSPAAANPTLVNNVETLSAVPIILRNGGEWYRGLGTEGSPGTIVCTVSGDMMRHGVEEFELGTPLDEILDTIGVGLPAGRSAAYILPGVSSAVLTAGDIGLATSYEAFIAAGSGLGTGGFIVYDDRTDPLELATAVSQFLAEASCGQCPPCKLGCERVTELLTAGRGGPLQLAAVTRRLETLTDGARCYLPHQEQRVVSSLLPKLATTRAAMPERQLQLAPIVDLVDGRFILAGRRGTPGR